MTPRPSGWLDNIWWNATGGSLSCFLISVSGKTWGALGALSVDMTQANSTLPDDSQHDGQSVRFSL
ncbi:fimbria/pilus outer membrane usher protein [Escherichia coli]|nr:fimbria/pilus outer membrane usher protein [Escherichia coli]